MKFSFVYGRRKTACADGRKPVEMHIYVSRFDRTYIATGVNLYPDQWVDDWPKDRKAIKALIDMQSKAEKAALVMEATGIPITSKGIVEQMSGSNDLNRSFLVYMRDRIAERDLRPGTRKMHLVALDALRASHCVSNYASLTPSNIEAFDRWLKKDKTRKQTTIHGYHKRIKVYTAELYRLGHIKDDPYNHFKDDPGKYAERRPLTSDEVAILAALSLPKKLERVRDVFVFCCHTGLAYVDAMALTDDAIVTIDGHKYIDGERIKTGTRFFTPMLPKAEEIWDKYKGDLPFISNQKMNDYLKVVAAYAGITKPMTSHVARHSFATILLDEKKVSIESLSRMLGHTDIKTTQLYAKTSHRIVTEQKIW